MIPSAVAPNEAGGPRDFADQAERHVGDAEITFPCALGREEIGQDGGTAIGEHALITALGD
jgi:hypothetical protein